MANHLTLADVVAIHREAMLRGNETAQPLRDEGALDSAIHRTRAAEHYLGVGVAGQAALLAVGISQAQAFLDGNKRTAHIAMQVFLRLNGLDFVGKKLELARQLEHVADQSGDRAGAEEAFAEWVAARIRPVSQPIP